MTNSQDVFEREKELCEIFRDKEEKSASISYNVSSKGLVIWVQYDTENHWDWKRGELILTILIKNFKLDKVGYNEKLNVLRYKSPYWDPHPFTVEYYSPCPKFDSEGVFLQSVISGI